MDFNVIYLKTNKGHGISRKIAIAHCKYELVAIMDSDDISAKERLEKELQAHCKENISVVGGQIAEFIGDTDNIIGVRSVPQENGEIYDYLKKRCPFNQMTVMFRKTDVMLAGGYQDWYCNEDYFLWIRMAEKKMVFRNLPDILVYARVGEQMYQRRGGWKYFRSEQKLHYYMLKKRIITVHRYIANVVVRFGAQVICPDRLRKYLFKITRKKMSKNYFKRCAVQKECIYPKFSVAMSVYNGDIPEHFETALSSIVHQTVPPDEIVLVVDGPVNPKIQEIIEKYRLELR